MSKIVNFALLQVGKPYVFGRSGPSSYDCSGLTKRAVAQIGLDWYHGATKQWIRGKQTGPPERYAYFGETGQISQLPMGKVAFLFNQGDNGKMSHTGIYAGNGWVVQSGGYGGHGVHYNKLLKSKWTHYAVLTQFWTDKDEAGEDNMAEIALRRGMSGPPVAEMQKALIALGYNVGANTKADGKFGPATEAAVRKFQADEGLPVTGIWTPEDQNALDNALSDENGPPVNDDAPSVDNDALKAEARGLLKRLGAILDNLS